MSNCQIAYDPSRGELTGLVRYPADLAAYADCWWVHCVVRFPALWGRTDGVILPVRLPGACSVETVLGEVQRLLTILCGIEAVVTHLSPPMAREDIMAMQEINAQLAREIRARQRAEIERCHEEALAMDAAWRPAPPESAPGEPPAASHELPRRPRQLQFA